MEESGEGARHIVRHDPGMCRETRRRRCLWVQWGAVPCLESGVAVLLPSG